MPSISLANTYVQKCTQVTVYYILTKINLCQYKLHFQKVLFKVSKGIAAAGEMSIDIYIKKGKNKSSKDLLLIKY